MELTRQECNTWVKLSLHLPGTRVSLMLPIVSLPVTLYPVTYVGVTFLQVVCDCQVYWTSKSMWLAEASYICN